jgi:SAM-dependent methyltransferase
MVRRWVELPNKRLLDVGCGVGMYLAAFLRETPHVFGLEVEHLRAVDACGLFAGKPKGVSQGIGERLPFSDDTFDVVFSHEVLEHVTDDVACVAEMVRVTKAGGRLVIFVPNRLYPFETHGIYWRGRYRFGNIPLVNWLPRSLRDRLAPHVRTYTARGLYRLLDRLAVHVVHHTVIFPGYDNIVARLPTLGHTLRTLTYALEHTPLRVFGLSHFLVVEKTSLS